MAIVTLDEARAKLQILDSDTSQDTVLQAYCDAITPVVEKEANEVIEQRTITEDYDLSDPHAQAAWSTYGWATTLWLRQRPVISITSVTNDNNGVTWSPSVLRVRSDGRLRVKSGNGLYGYLIIVYVAGYATVPTNYKQWALEILQFNWESRRGVGNVPAGVMGVGEQINPDSLMMPPKAYLWAPTPTPGGP